MYPASNSRRWADPLNKPERTILTAALAQEIAADTSRIIGMNVLITDRDGTVIGNGDQTRKGTLHEASIEVLRTRNPVSHTAQQARELRGVKPGMTLPILLDGDVVGTVGITGSPADVRPFALLVQRQTEILLNEAELLQARFRRQQALEDLVRDISFSAFYDPDLVQPDQLVARAAELGVDLALPRAAIIVELALSDSTDSPRAPARPPPAPTALALAPSPRRTVREAFPAAQDIHAEMAAGRFAVLHHVRKDDAENDLRQRCENLAASIRERHRLATRIAIGQPGTGLAALAESYQDAATALRVGPNTNATGVFSIAELRLRTTRGGCPRSPAQIHRATTRGAAHPIGLARAMPDADRLVRNRIQPRPRLYPPWYPSQHSDVPARQDQSTLRTTSARTLPRNCAVPRLPRPPKRQRRSLDRLNSRPRKSGAALQNSRAATRRRKLFVVRRPPH